MKRTRKQILQWAENIEKFTGLDCPNIKGLPYNAPIEKLREAEDLDRNWFKGYADTIMSMC